MATRLPSLRLTDITMQLTQYEFDDLCLSDRLHLIGAIGVLLSRVQALQHNYSLYGVYDFYVEVVMNHYGSRIVQAVAFRDGNRLNKHLKEIDLSGLI